MSNNSIKLPMADNHGDTRCCQDTETIRTYEDPAGANWVSGQLETASGPVYRVATELDRHDLIGSVKARLGFGRMDYTIPPALYAVGNPDKTSAVLVSANYKLSFDSLRRELKGLNLWILVIDTKGINVWCAAGKGTFGTTELLRMIESSHLDELLTHRNLILPQLAAPGVSAHAVRKKSGFKVAYGPVRAADIPAFLSSGNKASPAMRRTRFNLLDRLILAPVELIGMIVPLVIFAAVLLLLNLAVLLARNKPVSLPILLSQTLSELLPFFIALIIGIIMLPALLPYIPGRALAWKGWVLGVLWAFVYNMLFAPRTGWLPTAAYYLILPPIPAFLGMNFTGSTTYTSLSGVVKEMGYALPLIIGSLILGLVAFVAGFYA